MPAQARKRANGPPNSPPPRARAACTSAPSSHVGASPSYPPRENSEGVGGDASAVVDTLASAIVEEAGSPSAIVEEAGSPSAEIEDAEPEGIALGGGGAAVSKPRWTAERLGSLHHALGLQFPSLLKRPPARRKADDETPLDLDEEQLGSLRGALVRYVRIPAALYAENENAEARLQDAYRSWANTRRLHTGRPVKRSAKELAAGSRADKKRDRDAACARALIIATAKEKAEEEAAAEAAAEAAETAKKLGLALEPWKRHFNNELNAVSARQLEKMGAAYDGVLELRDFARDRLIADRSRHLQGFAPVLKDAEEALAKLMRCGGAADWAMAAFEKSRALLLDDASNPADLTQPTPASSENSPTDSPNSKFLRSLRRWMEMVKCYIARMSFCINNLRLNVPHSRVKVRGFVLCVSVDHNDAFAAYGTDGCEWGGDKETEEYVRRRFAECIVTEEPAAALPAAP